jgi:hypothetical protein
LPSVYPLHLQRDCRRSERLVEAAVAAGKAPWLAFSSGLALPGQHRRDDGEVAPYYYEWASSIAEQPPERRANMLASLSEDDRLVVQRILDEQLVASSEVGARTGRGGPI